MQAAVAVGARAGDGEQVAVGRDRQPPGRQAGGRGRVGKPAPVLGVAAHASVGGGAEQPCRAGRRPLRAPGRDSRDRRTGACRWRRPTPARRPRPARRRSARRRRLPPGRSPAPAGRAAARPASPSRCRTHRCRTCRPTGRRWRRRRTAAFRPGSARRRRSRPPRRCRSAGAAPRARPRRAATRGGWSCRSRRWPAGARRRPPPDARMAPVWPPASMRRNGRCGGSPAAAASSNSSSNAGTQAAPHAQSDGLEAAGGGGLGHRDALLEGVAPRRVAAGERAHVAGIARLGGRARPTARRSLPDPCSSLAGT